MKFTAVWASTLSQNLTLRIVIVALSVVLLFFGVGLVRLGARQPTIIERECFSKVLTPASSKKTPGEIEAFLKVALPKRFDSDAPDSIIFLSSDEMGFRLKEQEELRSKNMTQRVWVNSVKMDGNIAVVDSDRLMSVGKVRSAFSFPLVVALSQTERTAANPYGLILEKVSPQKVKEDSK